MLLRLLMRVMMVVMAVVGVQTQSTVARAAAAQNVEATPRTEAPATDAVENDATPSGCLKSWLCYALPSDSESHPWVADNGWKYVALRGIGGILAGFIPITVVALAAQFAVPFALHFLFIPEDVRPPMSGGLLLFNLGDVVVDLVLEYALAPMLLLPCGLFPYVGLQVAWKAWLGPVTALHAYNRRMKQHAAETEAERVPGDNAPGKRDGLDAWPPPRDAAPPPPDSPAPTPAQPEPPVPPASDDGVTVK
jgi:hypothetical protein